MGVCRQEIDGRLGEQDELGSAPREVPVGPSRVHARGAGGACAGEWASLCLQRLTSRCSRRRLAAPPSRLVELRRRG
jgi:hypothetical protein